ncbi:RNA exonuclease 3, partial [Nowakowskiella sp. JEL0078]
MQCEFDLNRPPNVVLKPNDRMPHQTRQIVVNKFFAEFSRIYACISSSLPFLAHEHSLDQELAIYKKSNRSTYQTSAGHALKRLKYRPVAEDSEDIGIDGVWIKRVEKSIPILLQNDLTQFLMTNFELNLHNYPLQTQNQSIEDLEELKGNQMQTCDRCQTKFEKSFPLTEYDKIACNYHNSRVISRTMSGVNTRLYSCCQKPIESSGCLRGPHVFKVEKYDELNELRKFEKLLPSQEVTDFLPVVGIDYILTISKSYTAKGLELTRLTIVSAYGERIFDQICKPIYPIIDLNTEFSGITESMISTATYDFDKIQSEIRKIISEDTILVGHGLENDLKALRLTHEKIIDTAVIFPHPKSFPFKYSLRILAEKILKKTIQQGTKGHDSYEDAMTTLELLEVAVIQGKDRIH